MIKRKFLVAILGLTATIVAPSTHAVVLDLGTNGSGWINDAYFAVNRTRSTGTGVYDPFLTLRANGMQQGYNSSIGNFDTQRQSQWNHEIRFSDLQITVINSVGYFGFSIDVNEPNNPHASTITLEGLRIYTSPTLQTSTSTDGGGLFNGSLGILRYDLNLGGNNSILYDDRNSGSGSGDIDIFIPVSAFAGTQPNDYVYMYQLWGNADATSGGGFEETRLIAGTPIPELSSFFPIVGLLVAFGSTHALRRRRMSRMMK